MSAKARFGFHGLEIPVRAFSGARAVRVVHPPGQLIIEHRHDWPIITIPSVGGYDERSEDSEIGISGPAAVFHPAGHCHANCIHGSGMETFSIEFDPAWLRPGAPLRSFDHSQFWIGGSVAIAGRRLARIWSDPSLSEVQVRRSSLRFLTQALGSAPPVNPRWFHKVSGLLDLPAPPSTDTIARQLDLHPAWLARAYRQAAGEGLHDTIRRKRVERALAILRSSEEPLAEVAIAAGFCDQSHLHRAIREATGRTPTQVRRERELLTSLQVPANSTLRSVTPGS